MKVVLLRPPHTTDISADMSDIFDDDVGVYPPLGLLYLYSSVKHVRKDDQVYLYDCMIEGDDIQGMIDHLIEVAPDVIGITVLTFQVISIYTAISAIKKQLPHVKVVLGGPHVHLYHDEVLLNEHVDYVISGEGESSFSLFLERLEAGSSPSDVPGIYYRNDEGGITKGSVPEVIRELDDLPPLDYRALPVNKYTSAMSSGPFAMLMTSRGCPFKCIYCDRPHLGSKFRAHSPERVMRELRTLAAYGIRNIQFFDDTFTLKRSRVVELCQSILKEGLDISFSVRARVTTVDKELLELMKRAGCSRISFGVEAGSDEALRGLRKDVTINDVRKAFALCKQVGIDTLADFILGGPGQTRKDVEETISFAVKLDPSYVQFTIMTPFPGTELYELGRRNGLIKNDYWLEFAQNPKADFETPVWEEHLKKDELLELFSQAYRRFYRRPGYVLKELFKIRSLGEFTRKARIGLKTLFLNEEKLGK